MSDAGLRQALDEMRARGMGSSALATFDHYYRLVEGGDGGLIPEDTIEPLRDVPRLGDERADPLTARAALAQVAVVKLNGGLGTSMGLEGPKSTLPVRDGLSFLDIIARQVLALRSAYGIELPLVLMNSFRTREDSLAVLERYPTLPVHGLPLDFLQSAEPKLRADDLTPVRWPDDPELEWCPPGHGDVYVSMRESGLLAALRSHGVRWVFLSNADNLGATCDPDVAAWVMTRELPFLAEVCQRTTNDRKGGHVALRRSDGRLVLRESAMTPPQDVDAFQDITRHTMFNSNNLWVDIEVLERLLDDHDGVLGLPVIVNHKTVDPARSDSTPVIQIESAMGTAIERIDGAEVLEVPRSRFRPVKGTDELLIIRSDLFALDDDYRVVAARTEPDPRVDLDDHYTVLADFEARFPAGPPSLRRCSSLTVRGDVTFGEDVECVGDVSVVSARPAEVPDGAELAGEVDLSVRARA